MNSQTDRFIQLYKKLEFEGRRIYFPDSKPNESIIGRLFTIPQLKPYKEDLDYCRVVRNFLTHNPKVGGVYPIIPSPEMLKLLEKCLLAITNPPKAINYSIPIDKIFTTTLDEKVSDVITIMNKFIYTHVPVTDNEKFIGIFSESTIYTYICRCGSAHINENTLIREFIDYLPPDEHINEYFAFIQKDALLHEVQDLFKYTLRRNKLLTVVYLTETGKRTEPILGMITPWDLLEQSFSEY